MTRITGQQARQLLDGATPGPWEFFHDEWDHDEDGESRFEQWGVIGGSDGIMTTSPREALFNAPNELVDEHDHAANLKLAAAAPALAETIAWLYGRESDLEREHYTNWYPTDRADQWGVSTMKWKGNVLLGDNHSMQASELSPDEAVDLARALLAAAQEARRD